MTIQEAQLLGSLLYREGEGIEALPFDEQDFVQPDHRKIWRAIQRLRADGCPANEHTVYPVAGCRASVVSSVVDTVCSSRNLEHFAAQLAAEVSLRKVAEAQRRLAGNVSAGADPIETSREAQQEIDAIRAKYLPSVAPSEFDDAASSVFDDLRNGVVPDVLYSGLQWFDRITMGWMPGEQMIVGARPGAGKTDLAIQLMIELSLSDTRSCFFSIEMTAKALFHRVLAVITGEDTNKVFRAHSPDSRVRGIVLSTEAQARQVIRNIDLHTRNISNLEAMLPIIRRSAQGGSRIVFVDYLQLMNGQGRTRTEEIERISRGLREAAKHHGMTNVLLAQISRDIERDQRMPKLSDLKDSGAIEQDADTVLFLHRPDPNKPATQAMIAKGRNIGRGFAKLIHTGATHKFYEEAQDCE
jgi:replicative DNA helicase